MDDATIERLVAAAREVRSRAYCPYSSFAVGAALLDEDGNVHCGVNVENAAYPVGMCAERAAIAVAVSAGARKFQACAVVTSAPVPVAPCGMCRQALSEFGDLTLILAAPEGDYQVTSLAQVLPFRFDPTWL